MDGFRNFSEAVDLNTEHDIINMYQDSGRYRVSDISDLTGISPAGIYRVLRKYQMDPHRKPDLSHYEQIYQYRSSGVPVRRIAELTGYSRRQVYNIINQQPLSDERPQYIGFIF